MGPPTVPEINRYRTHHGANIGSVFVLERWLFPGMFLDTAKGGSELSAVSAWVEAHGIESARAKWEEHWASAMTPADWVFLRDTAKVTSVRLPIGWFTLGPHYCGGTAFEPYAAVYENAWMWVRRYVQAAAEHGIGVLLDLHALPGGANTDEHSGTDSKKSEFWENDWFRQRATEVLVAISRAVAQDPIMKVWVIGLQLVNEAITGAGDRGMWTWYDGTLGAIAAIDSTLPVYLSDAWNSVPALDYAVGKNNARRSNPLISPPLVIDIHKYYCFDAYNKNRSPAEIIATIAKEGSDIASYNDKEVGTVIGEYSCVLDGESWAKVSAEARPDLVRQFGIAQSQRWEQTLKPVNGGAFFWTAKMAWMDGGEWGFVEQSRKGNVVPPVGLTLAEQRVAEIAAEAKREQARIRTIAIEEHAEYWNQNAPGQNMEHYRFAAGYDVGFWDALTFWESARKGATIGFVNLWSGKRLREHVAETAGFGSQFLWEFEHGFKRGLKDMESFIK
ncbi:putative glucan 1,3-beta-glucosidase precursor [Tricharina praecox]|uniref:putative glucan 1,3-beta-glucosidase precursor n=1 Tax=Tricharina praecox TaxID=43433 RepID=UPI00221E5DEB|nr:putative glucan 1,3-beta-glucosidase precursor [Tricharina praecox]KAI5857002.1 putative glucan 1,3-beta-glucosidase precursor [Tricharina praecox]